MIEVNIQPAISETLETTYSCTHCISIEITKDDNSIDMSITLRYRSIVEDCGNTENYLDEFEFDGRPNSHEDIETSFCDELKRNLDLTEKEVAEIWSKVDKTIDNVIKELELIED